MLLTGVALGLLIAILFCTIIYLKGQNMAYRGQINDLAVKQLDADQQVAAMASKVQDLRGQPIVVNMPDEHINILAAKISGRVQIMMDAANEAALKKLN